MAQSYRTINRTQANRCERACQSGEIVCETFEVAGTPFTSGAASNQ
jgi:hypothetical protein